MDEERNIQSGDVETKIEKMGTELRSEINNLREKTTNYGVCSELSRIGEAANI